MAGKGGASAGLLGVLLLVSASASAETYYVAQASAGASDANPGTESEPWASMAHAVSSIAGGDEVIIRAGTYTGGLNIVGLVGSEAAPTALRAYPGDTVIIQGHEELAVGVTGGRVRIQGCHHLILQGLEVRHFNQGIFVDEASEHVTLAGCTVHHVGQEAIHVRANSTHVTIESCLVHDTRQWQYNGEGIYVGTGSAGPLDNTSFVVVRSNVIYGVTDEAIELKPGTHDCIVEGNTIYEAGSVLDASWGVIEVNEHALGVQTWGEDPNHLVRNNIIHDTAGGCGIRAGTGVTVYNNVLYDLPGWGIHVTNLAADPYERRLYHNTIDLASADAIYLGAGATDVRNNIGPASADNLPANAAFFLDTAEGAEDYHLVAGSAPVDQGVDLTASVDRDRDGRVRPFGVAPDLGAYEFGAADEDAGSGGASPTDAGAGGDGPPDPGSGGASVAPTDDGCGCRTLGRTGARDGHGGLVLLGGLGLGRAARRRRPARAAGRERRAPRTCASPMRSRATSRTRST